MENHHLQSIWILEVRIIYTGIIAPCKYWKILLGRSF